MRRSARRRRCSPRSRCCGGTPRPPRPRSMDALGGVLCRCTGYRAIVDGGRDAALRRRGAEPPAGGAVGRRLPRLDGARKLSGAEIFGADEWPADALRRAGGALAASRTRVSRSAISRLSSPPIPASSPSSPRSDVPGREPLRRDRRLRRPAGARRRRRALSRRGGGAGRRRGRGDAGARPRALSP